MNINLKNTPDGTKADYKMLSVEGFVTSEIIKTGRIYYPFVINGSSGQWYLEHLTSGMSMSEYKWRTLAGVRAVVNKLRQVIDCDTDEPLANRPMSHTIRTTVVQEFAAIIRDSL